MANLASNLADTARAHAGRVAVRVGEVTTTYSELDAASAGVAGMLRQRGLKPGDRVGIMLPNVAEFAVVYYGVLRAGGVVVPMNPLLKVREVAYYLSDSRAGLIFAWHAFGGEARGGAERAAAEARGAALPVEVLRGFGQAFGCMVLEGYGLSETSPVASFNLPDRERKPGSIGTPVRGVQMRVVDPEDHEVPQGEVGEIAVRGPNVMKGYWHRPEATAEAIRDGWFHTGDLARVDEDGYFSIVDRKKDLIIRGGYNIYPREIEEVLYEHPAVAEAAVIGVPHPALGEEVGAAVTLKADASVTAEELRDHVKAQVAAYKYPRHVWIVDVLPKGPTGKILKREIVVPTDPVVP